MGKINLVMPMGGKGERFFNEGFLIPKPLINIHEKPFFYWATQSILKFTQVETLTFVVLKEHIEQFKIDKVIRSYYPNAEIVILDHVLAGASLTCNEGVQNIDNNYPIVFNDCDHAFICNSFYEVCKLPKENFPDGALLTFNSDLPKYSYIKYNEHGEIVGTVEKQAVSNDAICGAYVFKNKEIFIDGLNKYLKNCNYNEFFVSGIYNQMSKLNCTIKKYTCDIHIPFGTPDEYESAQNSNIFEMLE